MWAFFRVENEHLNNVADFRRIDFVPLHFETAVVRRGRMSWLRWGRLSSHLDAWSGCRSEATQQAFRKASCTD